ncbi:unnamed protein product [Ectocarpus sp. 12 AP-2014]
MVSSTKSIARGRRSKTRRKIKRRRVDSKKVPLDDSALDRSLSCAPAPGNHCDAMCTIERSQGRTAKPIGIAFLRHRVREAAQVSWHDCFSFKAPRHGYSGLYHFCIMVFGHYCFVHQ